MSETKAEYKSDGSTIKAPAGEKSLTVMTDGNETDDMLLALLNNALASMTKTGQAKIFGHAKMPHEGGSVPTTIILVFGTLPTDSGTLKHAER